MNTNNEYIEVNEVKIDVNNFASDLSDVEWMNEHIPDGSWINLDDFKRDDKHYQFRIHKSARDEETYPITISFKWDKDSLLWNDSTNDSTYESQRFIEVIEKMKGKFVRWTGYKSQEGWLLNGIFYCQEYDGKNLITGIGAYKQYGIRHFFRRMGQREENGEITYWVEHISGYKETQEDIDRQLSFKKDELRDELLAELRLSSRVELNNKGDNATKYRSINILSYVAVLRQIMARLCFIDHCTDENYERCKSGKYNVTDKQLKCFANSNIRLQKYAGSVNDMLRSKDPDSPKITFDHIWKVINMARYSHTAYRYKGYTFLISDSFTQVCTFHGKDIGLSVYRIIDYVEAFINEFFSKEENDNEIRNFMRINFNPFGHGYSIRIPQDNNITIKESLQRDTEEKFDDVYIKKLNKIYPEANISFINKDDIPISPPYLDVLFPADMHEIDFESWAKEHAVEMYKYILKQVAEQLNDMVLPSDKEIITGYTLEDLKKNSVSILEEFLPDEVLYNPNGTFISPIYRRIPPVEREGVSYLPEYVLLKGAFNSEVDKIAIYKVGHDEDPKNKNQFFRAVISFTPRIEILDLDKVYRLLVKANGD